jgi:uncharacterized membrane protein required for colicin V production
MRTDNSISARIIQAVTAPLGFFVLALLIVESFLAAVVVGGNLEKTDKIVGMWMGVGLFVLVTIIVFVLVWYKADNLTFDKEAHLINRGRASYGSDSKIVKNIDSLLPSESPKESK